MRRKLIDNVIYRAAAHENRNKKRLHLWRLYFLNLQKTLVANLILELKHLNQIVVF